MKNKMVVSFKSNELDSFSFSPYFFKGIPYKYGDFQSFYLLFYLFNYLMLAGFFLLKSVNGMDIWYLIIHHVK